MIETAPDLGNDGDLGLTEAQHEAQFALAKDRHQWVDHRADTIAGKDEGDEFPPIRQLKSNDIAWADAQVCKALGNLVDPLAQFAISEADLAADATVPADKGRALGAKADGSVEIIDGEACGPKFLGCFDASRRQPNVEAHFLCLHPVGVVPSSQRSMPQPAIVRPPLTLRIWPVT